MRIGVAVVVLMMACGGPGRGDRPRGDPAAAEPAGSAGSDAAATGDSAPTPVIVVATSGAVSVDGREVARSNADVTEPVAAALATVRRTDPGAPRTLIVQADESTSALTINQIVIGAARAGFDQVLFADRK